MELISLPTYLMLVRPDAKYYEYRDVCDYKGCVLILSGTVHQFLLLHLFASSYGLQCEINGEEVNICPDYLLS